MSTKQLAQFSTAQASIKKLVANTDIPYLIREELKYILCQLETQRYRFEIELTEKKNETPKTRKKS